MWPEGTGRTKTVVSPDAFRVSRRIAAEAMILTGVLAIVGTPRPRKNEPRSAVDDIIGPHTESVLLTRTAPPGPRLIEVSRWEDLVKASAFMGRPILRLDDGTRSVDQPLFYVPDGPQSYVFDFQREGVHASKSGGYALPPEPVAAESLAPAIPEAPERVEPSPADERPLPEPARPPDATPVPLPDEKPSSGDEVVEQYLGPDVAEPEGATGLPGKNRVEREIRGMIQEAVAGLRNLPAGSSRKEEGTYHVQRALELLQLGRYGSAQIEVNRAARLMQETHRK